MGRKKGKTAADKQRTTAEYYKLNTKAVDDLVTADVSNSPKVSEAELRKYRSGPRIHLKDWVKAVLIKWWFAGAVCFFFYWGLGMMVQNQENQLLILGLALGFVTDLLVNNIFRYYEKTPGANSRWMMFGKKKFVSLPLNVLYGFLLLALVVMTYNTINSIVAASTVETDKVALGVEPLLFGLFTVGWDLLLLGAKRLIRRMVDDAKRQAR